MAEKSELECVCCGEGAEFTVALITRNDRNENERYSLPHRAARGATSKHDLGDDTPFCKSCMQSVGNAVRATIRNLQYEHGRNQKRFRQSAIQ